MGPLRFSLASLIGLIALLALGLAALQSSSGFWVSLVISSVLFVLITSLACAATATGSSRARWCGFAIFGWSYLALALGPWAQEHVAPHLVTTHALTALQTVVPQFRVRVGDKVLVQWGSSWYRSSVLSIQNGQFLIHYEGYSSASDEIVTPNRIRVGRPEYFHMIGHSFFAVLLGFIGGGLALYVYQRQRHDGPHAATQAAGPRDGPRDLARSDP
jgi:hypothetical protein